jgi:hypothetical protein
MQKFWIWLVVAFGLAGLAKPAAGQLPYRNYTPPGGAVLPPQLEYFRPQSGLLDQYNQFVAPRENLANQLRSMAGQQNADFQAVQNKIKESDLIRESEAAATGTAAGFMNYSHYYGNKGTGQLGSQRQITPQRRYTTTQPGVGTGMGLPGGIGSGIGPGSSGFGGFGGGNRYGR